MAEGNPLGLAAEGGAFQLRESKRGTVCSPYMYCSVRNRRRPSQVGLQQPPPLTLLMLEMNPVRVSCLG